MLRALFWTVVGFIGGVLFMEWLSSQDRVQEGSMRATSSMSTTAQRLPNLPTNGGTRAAPPVPKVKVARDDLTTLKGVGPTFARRLNDAGIMTFAQLAEAEPELLRAVTQIREWQRPSAEDWIAEARSLI